MIYIHRTILFYIISITAFGAFADTEPFDFLVLSDWVNEQQQKPSTVILEVRFDPENYTKIGHIPGAVKVERLQHLADQADPWSKPVVFAPGKTDFERTLQNWGVTNDSTLVLYDDSRSVLVSRLYVLLDHYGFNMQRVKILNGGTTEWTTFNELTKTPSEPKQGNVRLGSPRDVLIERPSLAELISNKAGFTLVDSRPAKEYQDGHLPGAVNISSIDGTDPQTWVWLSKTMIETMYAQVPRDRPVVTYCNDGFRSTLGYMQLKALGYEKVRVYNGGWPDWKSSGN